MVDSHLTCLEFKLIKKKLIKHLSISLLLWELQNRVSEYFLLPFHSYGLVSNLS